MTIGVLSSYVIGALVTWRWLSVICIGFSFIWICGAMTVPETPSHHLRKGNEEEATLALMWLRGNHDQREVAEEIDDIREGIIMASSNQSVFSLLFQQENLIPVLISLLLMFAQQFSGISVVVCYTDDIFAAAQSSLSPSLQTIILGSVQVVATFVGAVLVDKLGRRFLLLFSSLGMFLSLVVLGSYFFIKVNLQNTALAESISILPVISLSSYIATFSVGLGPVPWLMMSELFSPPSRGIASSLAVGFNWTLCFVTVKYFPALKDLIGMAITFWSLGAILVVSAVLIYLVVPETKGETLEEIQRRFKRSENSW